MNGYNFTDRVRKTLQYAREEAVRLHHPYVGVEHIVLGLLREGEGVAAAVMRECQVQPDALRARIEERFKAGEAAKSAGADLPYTSHGKHALERAMAEARALGYPYVGTEHLLLGVLAAPGPVPRLLADGGLTLERARDVTVRLRPPAQAAPGGSGLGADQVAAGFGLGRRDSLGRVALLLSVIALLVALVALALALRAGH